MANGVREENSTDSLVLSVVDPLGYVLHLLTSTLQMYEYSWFSKKGPIRESIGFVR